MVRRLIVAAAVAVASLGANADWIYWNFKAPDGNITGTTLNNVNATHSLYVFVSDVTEGDMNSPGTYTSGAYKSYGAAVKAISYTTQKPEEALSKFSSIRAGTASADSLGNLLYTSAGTGKSLQTGLDSHYSAIGAASFTAFAIVFDAANVKDAQNYMLLEDFSVITGNKNVPSSLATTYASAETAIKSEAGTNYKTVVFGDGRTGASTSGTSTASGASTKWEPIATIPEPTSGVMLLLGVAALALKRKRH